MTIEEFIYTATQINGWKKEIVKEYIEGWNKKSAEFKKSLPLEASTFIREKAFYVRTDPCEPERYSENDAAFRNII